MGKKFVPKDLPEVYVIPHSRDREFPDVTLLADMLYSASGFAKLDLANYLASAVAEIQQQGELRVGDLEAAIDKWVAAHEPKRLTGQEIPGQHVFQTDRFDVFRVAIQRFQGCGRDVFMAWYHTEDIPRPVCEITLFGNYIEWIQVSDDLRRQGIATEVLTGLENHVGSLVGEGVTEVGKAFCDAFKWREASPELRLPVGDN